MTRERRIEREKQPLGSVEVITGCMFSGKSDELIRRLRRAEYAKKKVQIFYPVIDDRREKETINSYDGLELDAKPVRSSLELLSLVDIDTDWVAIDEAQFMDEDLVSVVYELASRGKRVIVAGLDYDFRREPFGPMGDLLLEADDIKKLSAFCNNCGEKARFTQRLKGTKKGFVPVEYTDPIVLVGGEDQYEARCRNCHDVPGKPKHGIDVERK